MRRREMPPRPVHAISSASRTAMTRMGSGLVRVCNGLRRLRRLGDCGLRSGRDGVICRPKKHHPRRDGYDEQQRDQVSEVQGPSGAVVRFCRNLMILHEGFVRLGQSIQVRTRFFQPIRQLIVRRLKRGPVSFHAIQCFFGAEFVRDNALQHRPGGVEFGFDLIRLFDLLDEALFEIRGRAWIAQNGRLQEAIIVFEHVAKTANVSGLRFVRRVFLIHGIGIGRFPNVHLDGRQFQTLQDLLFLNAYRMGVEDL
jgi:hypothetical protein